MFPDPLAISTELICSIPLSLCTSGNRTCAGKMNLVLSKLDKGFPPPFSSFRFILPCLPSYPSQMLARFAEQGWGSRVCSGAWGECSWPPNTQQGDAVRLQGWRHLLQCSPSFAHIRYSISGAAWGCFLEVSLSKRCPPLPAARVRPAVLAAGVSLLHYKGQGIMGIPLNSVQENAVCKCN